MSTKDDKEVAACLRGGELDQISLDAAREINDVFAQSHHGVAQRTARVQMVVRLALVRARGVS